MPKKREISRWKQFLDFLRTHECFTREEVVKHFTERGFNINTILSYFGRAKLQGLIEEKGRRGRYKLFCSTIYKRSWDTDTGEPYAI